MAVDTVAAIRDNYNTLTGGQTSRQVIDMSDDIDTLNPTRNPFIVLLKKGLGTRTATNWKYEWMTDVPFPHVDTLAASTTSSPTSCTVTNYAYWQVWDMFVEMATYRVFVVTALAGTPTLTIAEITSGSGNIPTATPIVNIGSRFESGATFKDPLSTKEDTDYNYIQIVRDSVGMDEVLQATKMYGGPDWAYQRRKKGEEHARKLERAAIWSERGYVTTGTHPAGSSRGLHNWIAAGGNVTASLGATTLTNLENFVRPVVDQDQEGNGKYFLMTSSKVAAYISQGAYTYYKIETDTSFYGLVIQQVKLPCLGGKPLNIIVHPEFVDSNLTTASLATSGYLVCMDPSRMKHVTLAGNGVNLDTHLRTSIQNPGYTYEVDEYYTAWGFECRQPQLSARFAGASAPS